MLPPCELSSLQPKGPLQPYIAPWPVQLASMPSAPKLWVAGRLVPQATYSIGLLARVDVVEAPQQVIHLTRVLHKYWA
jgi:hypothetical protein